MDTTSLRICTWNCFRGKVDDKLGELAAFNPDVVALQECMQPDTSNSNVLWVGDSDLQGLAVWVRPGLILESRPRYANSPTALAATISGDLDFNILVVWAHRQPTYTLHTGVLIAHPPSLQARALWRRR